MKEEERFKGKIFLSYILYYGVFRFIIEFFRADPRGFIWSFSISQWMSIIIIIFAGIWWKILRRKGKPEDVGRNVS